MRLWEGLLDLSDDELLLDRADGRLLYTNHDLQCSWESWQLHERPLDDSWWTWSESFSGSTSRRDLHHSASSHTVISYYLMRPLVLSKMSGFLSNHSP